MGRRTQAQRASDAYSSQAIRERMGRDALVDQVVEAALDQDRPTEALRNSLQRLLTHTKHRHRDRSRDPVRRVEDDDEE